MEEEITGNVKPETTTGTAAKAFAATDSTDETVADTYYGPRPAHQAGDGGKPGPG